jgi:hypothetical protein
MSLMMDVILRRLCRFLSEARRELFISGEKTSRCSASFRIFNGFIWTYGQEIYINLANGSVSDPDPHSMGYWIRKSKISPKKDKKFSLKTGKI